MSTKQNKTWNEAMSQMLTFLNEEMQRFEHTAELQQGIDHLVEALGTFFGADTVRFYKKEDMSYNLASIWPDCHQSPQPELIHMIRHLEPRFWSEHLIEQKDTSGSHILYLRPLMDQETVLAVLMIADPDEEKKELLRGIADLLGNWLSNRLLKRDLLNRDNRVQKLLSGLGNDYTAVYVINLETDSFEIVINQNTNNVARLSKHNDFSSYLDNYADTYVLESSREEMKRVLRHGNIKQHFQTHEDLYFRFHSVPNVLGQTCFEAHAVRQPEKNGLFAVIGFRCVDRIVNRELEYQRQLDRAYQTAQKQLDIISASIPGGIKISNDDPLYTFRYVSRQYAAMLGYDSVEEFMEASGGSIVGIAHPDDVENGIAQALDQYSRGDSYAITYRMRCKDGSWKYIEDHGHKVLNEEGKVEHWNLILDKHELVEKTIELESEKRAGEAKMAFLSRMSHDIRTPLNGIIGLIDYDDRHPDNLDSITQNRQKARVAADHLLALVNDVLELNKLNDTHVTLVEEAFNFLELMRDVRTIAEMRAAEESINVSIDNALSYTENEYIIGSPLHVRQIFINLITNAIKYNRIGGSVCCRLENEKLPDGRIRFFVCITDNGIGMSENFQEKLFDPFAQEKNDARSVYQGTGLGMPIVKRLVDRMGGTLKVKSKQGKGTRVEVTLTFAEADHVPEQSAVPKQELCRDFSHLHVLLVEDNELNLEIARSMLEDEQMTVTEARDGQQALTLFEQSAPNTFDLILMDVMMPVMDGLRATRQIRQLARLDAKTIPIFAMTANAFAEDVQRTREAGMNEHIAKPIDMQTLMRQIARYCRKEEKTET